MNVLLVSECSKAALRHSQRILDQFAERTGRRTWQTAITQEGLNTLRKMLRRNARKNTAICCRWIKGRNRNEVLWYVGNRLAFGEEGAVPTNITRKDILRSRDENDWHTGEVIYLLATLGALFHDLGKAIEAFQLRLQGKLAQRNQIRHEWVSARLLQAFVNGDSDEGWLKRLSTIDGAAPQSIWLDQMVRDGLDEGATPLFADLPPLARGVAWAVLTHHRLPARAIRATEDQSPRWGRPDPQFNRGALQALCEAPTPLDAVRSPDWNEVMDAAPNRDTLQPYWRFPHGLPLTPEWCRRARHLAELALRTPRALDGSTANNLFALHLARLSLMQADQYYSALEDMDKRVTGEPDHPLWANTYSTDPGSARRRHRGLKQRLDEHILGVERETRAIARSLPDLRDAVPRLGRHRLLQRPTAVARFRWQNRAFDLCRAVRERAAEQGFFGINMASTGCGKTIGNARICYALSRPSEGARFSIALGLRTLTLQTGEAYRTMLQLDDDELAIRVGGTASKALFEHYEAQAAESGSESNQPHLAEDEHVFLDGDFDGHPILRRLADQADRRVRAMVSAPVLTCTVDHLVPATESLKGGRQIPPMLRLLTSDLVLDEIDDYGLEDMPALTRLVFWAGLLGSRVVLSSATLPPSLVEGLFLAYQEGRRAYEQNRSGQAHRKGVVCAWFDEHEARTADCASREAFSTRHTEFVTGRLRRLGEAARRRTGYLVDISHLKQPSRQEDLPEDMAEDVASVMAEEAEKLHQANASTDPKTGKRVSFGLIRMANIQQIVAVARALYQIGPQGGDTRIHLRVYHAGFPLLMRSEIEHQLDSTLVRKSDPNGVFLRPAVRQPLADHEEADHLFIVLGSPVTEVGRDHDYDWAIVEPSSMRSLIQLAGRVRRHRPEAYAERNIAILSQNMKALAGHRVAYCRPGFEDGAQYHLASHDLHHLLQLSEYQQPDAAPRIQQRDTLNPRDSLVDLEHARTSHVMLPDAPLSSASGGWCTLHPELLLLGTLQQQQVFRASDGPEVELAFVANEEEDDFEVKRLNQAGRERKWLDANREVRRPEPLVWRQAKRISTWGVHDYAALLARKADEMEMDLHHCGYKFGLVRTRAAGVDGGRWVFHEAIGLTRDRI